MKSEKEYRQEMNIFLKKFFTFMAFLIVIAMVATVGFGVEPSVVALLIALTMVVLVRDERGCKR